MELICFTDSHYNKDEAELITSMFIAGLKTLHIRKKNKSKTKLKALIEAIPTHYHNRIVLHHCYKLVYKYNLKGVHITRRTEKKWKKKLLISLIKITKPSLSLSRSIHELDQIKSMASKRFSYVFLSPVFDSISKKGYMASFTESDLRTSLPKSRCPVIALGGVEPNNVLFASKVGFKGVAALGYLWKDKSTPTIERFKWLKESTRPIHLE